MIVIFYLKRRTITQDVEARLEGLVPDERPRPRTLVFYITPLATLTLTFLKNQKVVSVLSRSGGNEEVSGAGLGHGSAHLLMAATTIHRA